MIEPSHTQIRQAVLPLDDDEVAGWTRDEATYLLQPYEPRRLGDYELWQLSPIGASRPVGIVVGCHVRTGAVSVTSGNAEGVAAVLAGIGPIDDEALAALTHALWRPIGRTQRVVPSSAHATRSAAGWVLAFDVEDAWNGVETWVARLDQGSAYIATSGVI